MIQQSEQINEIAKALNAVQATLEGAKKDSINPHFKNRYADLTSVWNAVRGPLGENGLAVIQTTGTDERGWPTVTTMLVHTSGQWVRDTLSIKPVKDSPQDVGSAVTYGRRYGLAAIVGVSPEDDDGEAAAGRGRRTDTTDAIKATFTAPPKPGPGNIVRPTPVTTPTTTTTVLSTR